MAAIPKMAFVSLIIVVVSTTAYQFTACQKEYISTACPDADTSPFVWNQAKEMGNGSFDSEWKPGTFPLGITPISGTNNHLWMPGQKAIWESSDGLNWQKYDKADWGERISIACVYFKDTMWMFGGMMYQSKEFMNDIWLAADGKNWIQNPDNAGWKPRKGHALVVFKNKLWLFGGSDGVAADLSPNSFLNDIWSSEDGKHWTLEKTSAEWPPREYPKTLVFKDTLYMLGGQGYSDVWKSANGKDWTMLTNTAPWGKRYDHGALVYDNKMWVLGGRAEISTTAFNDIWFSEDGVLWKNQTPCAPWTKRSAVQSIVFNDQLWLFSGKHTGSKDNWGGDIWTME